MYQITSHSKWKDGSEISLKFNYSGLFHEVPDEIKRRHILERGETKNPFEDPIQSKVNYKPING